MRRVSFLTGLVSTLALGACAVPPPSGPGNVMALPAQGKAFDAFQQDDMSCRGFASQMSGGGPAAQAATNNAVGSAIVGTAIGAGVGAALGSTAGAMGAGAAIGGATGLLAGSAVGANGAQVSAGQLQQRYDMAYTQCMYSRGNTVQAAPAGYGYAYGNGYGPAYGSTYAYPYPYYPYSEGSVYIGGMWGGGGHWGGGYRHGWR